MNTGKGESFVVTLIVIFLAWGFLDWAFNNINGILSVIFGIGIVWFLLRWFTKYLGEIILAVIIFAISYFVASFFTPQPFSIAALATLFLTVGFQWLNERKEKHKKATKESGATGATKEQ